MCFFYLIDIYQFLLWQHTRNSMSLWMLFKKLQKCANFALQKMVVIFNIIFKDMKFFSNLLIMYSENLEKKILKNAEHISTSSFFSRKFKYWIRPIFTRFYNIQTKSLLTRFFQNLFVWIFKVNSYFHITMIVHFRFRNLFSHKFSSING